MTLRVRTGLDVLAASSFGSLRGQRLGVVAHPASVDSRLAHIVDLLIATGLRPAVVFGPEHGFLGEAQDLIGVGDTAMEGIRIVSLYGSTVASLRPTREQLEDLDVLVIDLQDVGSRYYTFQATMLYCLEAAAECGVRVVVLDRPNPIGGVEVEGPALVPGYESFIGAYPIAVRHGLTVGELATLYRAERRINVDLTVVRCEGWTRDMDWDATGLSWVLPSPNMPIVDTAYVYPGQCLIEGTNVSEGRGTTRPFELCGFPGINARSLCARLSREGLPGVAFRSAWFQPTFQKHVDKLCAGVQLHVVDRLKLRPVRMGLVVLAALREAIGNRFEWRTEEYEFVRDPIAIDLLFGSDRERKAIEAGIPARDISATWDVEEADFRERRRPHLLY
ncbi:MAG: DUF1343 domain-containing protein [Gemmataceae bacterium]